MEPIWAAIVAGIALLFLVADFWWDKRKTEQKERQYQDGIDRAIERTISHPTIDEIMSRGEPPPMPDTYERNIHLPLENGNEPQAYYRMHGDVYILPLRSHEWETVRYALNTMPTKSLYTGDRNVIQRRMENVDKL